MLTKISPEGFDIANAYLELGTAEEVAQQLQLPLHEVVATLRRKDVKDYLDGIYLDMGYRNRDKMGALLDKIIDAKIAEAEETGVYTSKDLLEILALQHKMRMDELKLQKEQGPAQVTQIANFGEGNYGRLMEKLLANRSK
jgi:hypothetical protein